MTIYLFVLISGVCAGSLMRNAFGVSILAAAFLPLAMAAAAVFSNGGETAFWALWTGFKLYLAFITGMVIPLAASVVLALVTRPDRDDDDPADSGSVGGGSGDHHSHFVLLALIPFPMVGRGKR